MQLDAKASGLTPLLQWGQHGSIFWPHQMCSSLFTAFS